jgi:hypothetical protein
MPILYMLADRKPFAGAIVSWFDVMSDRQALDLSQQLLSAPPPVVVVAELPEYVLASHEKLFREGKEMGQREIIRTIAELERTKKIVRIDSVNNLYGLNIVIYARSDRAPSSR